MLDDVQAVADFYQTEHGRATARLLARHLRQLWPDLSRQTLLGLGHTTPFLPLWAPQLRLCIDAATSASAPRGAGASDAPLCLVQDDALPFPDRSVDRVLLAHALETATDTTRMLRAAWRVLRDDGRLMLVVPNRTGLWAHIESTPFADGAPCSTGRIERLLARSLFRIERLQGALYGPPGRVRPLLRAGPTLEAAGRFVTPRLAGVLVVEAVKDVHAAVPAAHAAARLPARRVLVPLRSARAGHRAPA